MNSSGVGRSLFRPLHLVWSKHSAPFAGSGFISATCCCTARLCCPYWIPLALRLHIAVCSMDCHHWQAPLPKLGCAPHCWGFPAECHRACRPPILRGVTAASPWALCSPIAPQLTHRKLWNLTACFWVYTVKVGSKAINPGYTSYVVWEVLVFINDISLLLDKAWPPLFLGCDLSEKLFCLTSKLVPARPLCTNYSNISWLIWIPLVCCLNSR